MADSGSPARKSLSDAIIEVGRLIEAAEPHERREQVRTALDTMTPGEREDFAIGVFIWAHEMRLWIEAVDA
jgi:hypothetical protein